MAMKIIQIYLSEQQKREVEDLAGRHCLATSSYVRSLLIRELNRFKGAKLVYPDQEQTSPVSFIRTHDKRQAA